MMLRLIPRVHWVRPGRTVNIGNVEGEPVKSSPEYSAVSVTHSVAFGEQTVVINGPRAQGFI